MEIGTIEREMHIEASPEVVYRVVSEPGHLSEWWPDDAKLEPVTGGTGYHLRQAGRHKVEALTVVEADPPRRFAFRWVHDHGQVATPDNSLLVTFDLVPSGSGTLLRFSEQGFRERGWERPCSRSSTATTSPAGTTSCLAWSRTPVGWRPRHERRRDRRRPLVRGR